MKLSIFESQLAGISRIDELCILGVQGTQPRQLRLVGAFGGESRCGALQGLAHLIKLQEHRMIELDHRKPSVRMLLGQALSL